MPLERALRLAHQEVDAPHVVQRRRHARPVPRHLEQLLRQLQVGERARVLPQRAEQPADPSVRRAPLGRQVEPPGQPQHLLKKPDRLARPAEPRRHVARRVERVHLGHGVVEVEVSDPGQVERVRPIEQQVVAGQPRRHDVAVGRAAPVARLFVEPRQRLQPLLARVAAAALQPLRRERLAPPASSEAASASSRRRSSVWQNVQAISSGIDGRLVPLEEPALPQALQDLLDLGDGRIGGEHRRLVGGRGREPPERDHAAGPELIAEDRRARQDVALGGRQHRDARVRDLLARRGRVLARRPLLVEAPAVGRGDQDPMLPIGAQELAGQERVAARRVRHLLAEARRRRARPAERRCDQQIDLHPGERLQVDPGVVAAAAPPTRAPHQQLRPRGGDDQDRRVGQLGRQALDLDQRIVVGVLQVLADDDQRTQGGVLLEESSQDRARQLRPLFRAPGQRAAEGALGSIEPQEPPEQRRELGDAAVAEHLLQLSAKLKQRLVGPELGQAEADPQEVRDEGAARRRGGRRPARPPRARFSDPRPGVRRATRRGGGSCRARPRRRW